ncbi:hypothetical protein AHAS_Ahas02G0184500 [Arachis hypogaea]
MFELLDGIVEEIGEQNVVQVVTDNGSNYVLADIGKILLIQKTIKSAISLVSFTYSHSSTLSMLRYFTNGKELVRHAVARFFTSFLSLESLYEEKENLRRMFTSDENVKEREATKIVIRPSFWNHVLRLVDGEKKPPMDYIYEAIEKMELPTSSSIACSWSFSEFGVLDLEVTKGWFECITRLVPSIAVQEKILDKQAPYKAGED